MADAKNSKYTAQEIESIFDKINSLDTNGALKSQFIYTDVSVVKTTETYFNRTFNCYTYDLGFKPYFVMIDEQSALKIIYDSNEYTDKFIILYNNKIENTYNLNEIEMYYYKSLTITENGFIYKTTDSGEPKYFIIKQ